MNAVTKETKVFQKEWDKTLDLLHLLEKSNNKRRQTYRKAAEANKKQIEKNKKINEKVKKQFELMKKQLKYEKEQNAIVRDKWRQYNKRFLIAQEDDDGNLIENKREVDESSPEEDYEIEFGDYTGVKPKKN